MNFKKKLIFVSILPLCLGAGSIHQRALYFYSENVLYKLTGDSGATLDITIKPAHVCTHTLIARFYNNKTDALLFSTSFEETISSSGTTFTITYPLTYHLNGDGLRFEYELSYSSTIKTWSGVLYPYTQIVVNAAQHKKEIYKTQNRFIKVETEQVVTGESFRFNNFNEYLSKNDDNSIDFSTIYFNYLSGYDFIYSKAEYHIKDYNKVYPRLTKKNNEIVLKMNCLNDNGQLSFELAEKLYVNPTTLEMSSIRSYGYAQTKELYIPVGKQELLEENDSYILIKDAGYSSVDIMLPLSYYFNKKIVGLCYSSDYCIEGGIRE